VTGPNSPAAGWRGHAIVVFSMPILASNTCDNQQHLAPAVNRSAPWLSFMQCGHCQADNPDTGRFCTQCGSALLLRCANCGTENPPESNFCGGCGASLKRTPLRGFVETPPAPRQNLPRQAAPRPLVGGERRHLTVLFCDIVDSTMLA